MTDTPWIQCNLTFPGDEPLEREPHAVRHLTKVLPSIEDSGLITGWWFIRKRAWRIRYRLAGPTTEAGIDPVHAILTEGVAWKRDIYEPEVHAFGGPESMEVAHQLFQQDSHHLLPFLQNDPDDRREHSLILCTALMRAAGLDIYEQGDVWAKVAEQRAGVTITPVDPAVWASFTTDVSQLIRGRAHTDELDQGWIAAFTNAGSALKSLREEGTLTRGVRAITATHVIFHWNRIGLSAPVQAALARAAKDAVFGSRDGQ